MQDPYHPIAKQRLAEIALLYRFALEGHSIGLSSPEFFKAQLASLQELLNEINPSLTLEDLIQEQQTDHLPVQ